jgi:ketosteroid isomerase-like protein
MIAGIAFAFACSSPPPSAPRNEATQEGPGADSIKLFFDNFASGDWTAMRAVYHDTAAVYHNASARMSPDSIVAFHTARRAAYEKVEAKVFVPLVVNMAVGEMKGETWRLGWADLTFTIKGTAEVVRVPVQIAWQIKNGKVVREHAYYNSLGLYQALMKAQQLASTKK